MRSITFIFRGFLQSWGLWSASKDRTTERTPTKSAVIGLIANAMGRTREESVADLAGLKMGVAVVAAGRIMLDYQTAGANYFRRMLDMAFDSSCVTPKKHGITEPHTVLRNKYYIEDASFIVGFEGHEHSIEAIAEAIANPKRVIFLGRRACLASRPPEPVLHSVDLKVALLERVKSTRQSIPSGDRIAIHIESPFDPRFSCQKDVPLDFSSRTYGSRSITVEHVTTPPSDPFFDNI